LFRGRQAHGIDASLLPDRIHRFDDRIQILRDSPDESGTGWYSIEKNQGMRSADLHGSVKVVSGNLKRFSRSGQQSVEDTPGLFNRMNSGN